MAECDTKSIVVNEINTATCTVEPTCTPVIANVCTASSCTCGCSPCQCGQSAQPIPLPFYNQACESQESHTKVLLQQTFMTVVVTGTSFNMPACGITISGVLLPGVQTLQVGSNLWNSTYGYLEVVSYDFTTQTVSLKNNCYPGNASPGTLIPECTQFNVVDIPFSADDECGGDSSFVTTNFTAPAVGFAVTIDVSNLLGITVNHYVQISTGVYLVLAIINSSSISIKNDGSGAPGGTTIYARDVLGHCISPVTPVAVDPCVEEQEDSGALVICGSGGVTTLSADVEGQVPVCIDAVTGEVEFQTLDIPARVCTQLAACLVLVSGTLSYTNVLVVDSSIFEVEDILVIIYSGLDTYQWVVTNIPDATHIDIESVSGVQPLDLVIPEDIDICKDSCCAQLEYKIGQGICNRDWSAAYKHVAYVAYFNGGRIFGGGGGIATSVSPGELLVGDTISVIVTNDTCNDMIVTQTRQYAFEGNFNAAEGDWAQTNFEAWHGHDIVPIGNPHAVIQTPTVDLWDEQNFGIGFGGACAIAQHTYNKAWTFTQIYILAPGTELKTEAHTRLFYAAAVSRKNSCCCHGESDSPEATHVLTIESMEVGMNVVGLAIQVS